MSERPVSLPDKLPQHIAIIMDGNGRWAQARGLPRVAGHRAGVQTAKKIVRACLGWGIPVLTLYVFSTENWRRPASEVQALMQLLEEYVQREGEELVRMGVQLRVIGRYRELPRPVVECLEDLVARTRNNHRLTLVLALNYGGRSEIVDATRRLAEKVASGRMKPEDIDETTFAAHLHAPDLPDPDLVIRSGGEMRLSNFLLWQSAYSEIWSTDCMWPDFSTQELLAALKDFAARQRRFGGLEGV